jgi:hypothetical protein
MEDIVQRMWTSALALRGKELCSIINECVRVDESASTLELAKVARGINKLCVGSRPPFPPENTCYRGGGFDDRYRGFFAPGQRFRQPAYLATSFCEQVAGNFMRRSGCPKKVRWTVQIDPEYKCQQVNLVTKRCPGVQDEQEYLFAPYSVFKVVSADYSGDGSDGFFLFFVAGRYQDHGGRGMHAQGCGGKGRGLLSCL